MPHLFKSLALALTLTALLASPLFAQPQRVRDGLRQQNEEAKQQQQNQPAPQPAPQPTPKPAAAPAPAPTPKPAAPTPAKTAAPKAQEPSPLAANSPPFAYVWATAYHVDPSTTTDESGYFALNEGIDGTIYVGTAAYGRNAYIVAFDPKNNFKQTIVVDAHKVAGLPLTPTGYAAQAKFHTRNFTGPSGKIYIGTKQGYQTEDDKKNDTQYPGGYAMVYDPKTNTTQNLGMPFPGQGVIDTVADESRNLVYIVTCEDQHWMTYDLKAKKFKEIDPSLGLIYYATTLIDKRGFAHVINADSTLITYNPDKKKFDSNTLLVNTKINSGVPDPRLYPAKSAEKYGPPTWQIMPDGKTAYLILMSRPNLYRIDLSKTNPVSDTVKLGEGKLVVEDLGPMLKGAGFDSRSSMTVGPDGNLYILARVNNETGFGDGYLHHLVRYNTKPGTFDDLGVLAVKNPDFYGLPLPSPIDPATGKIRPFTHGYHLLPDKVLTPLHAHMGLIAAHDGTLYATILCPYSLLKIENIKAK
jgi:hypothetical protein